MMLLLHKSAKTFKHNCMPNIVQAYLLSQQVQMLPCTAFRLDLSPVACIEARGGHSQLTHVSHLTNYVILMIFTVKTKAKFY